MMAGGIFAVELPVDHVRDPAERMPVGSVIGGEGPADALRGQALMDLGVIDDIDVIVVGEEVVVAHASVREDGGRGEEEADCGELPWFVGGKCGGKGVYGRR